MDFYESFNFEKKLIFRNTLVNLSLAHCMWNLLKNSKEKTIKQKVYK